jgi:F0F1-type ATP synthase membrane subunit c/vacuolar-type H+-ATPase subunit K
LSSSSAYPGTTTQPGSPGAKAATAALVIASSAAIAAGALVAGIAAGSAVEARTNRPAAESGIAVTAVTEKVFNVHTTGGSSFGPLLQD